MTDPGQGTEPDSRDAPGGSLPAATPGEPARRGASLTIEIALVLGATAVPAIVNSALVLANALRDEPDAAYRMPSGPSDVATWLPAASVSLAWMCVIGIVVLRAGAPLRSFGLVKLPRPIDFVLAPALYYAHLGVYEIVPAALDVIADPARWPVPMSAQSPGQFTLLGHLVFVVAMIANGVAEELVMRCYLVTRLGSWLGSAPLAVIVSSSIYALYHLYQGPLAALCILCSGLLFGAMFVLRRSVWPIAAAHAALDVSWAG